MENYKINAAIQLLPLSNNIDKYGIVDKAIAIIQQSGLNYVVCPFETVIEGSFKEVVEVIEKIKNIGFTEGNDELIINLKLHCSGVKDLYIDDKTGKYR